MFDIEKLFSYTTPFKPLVFILSQGSDPRQNVENLAVKLKMDKRLVTRSMGQGQGEGT